MSCIMMAEGGQEAVRGPEVHLARPGCKQGVGHREDAEAKT